MPPGMHGGGAHAARPCGGGRTRRRTGCWRSSSGHRRRTRCRACARSSGRPGRRRRSGGRPRTGSPAAPPGFSSAAMRLTSTKWPRWLVPNWVSKPSAVLPFGAGHDAGVGDDQVERLAGGDQGVGAGAHAGQRGEVELDQLQAAAVRGLGADLGGRAPWPCRGRARRPTTCAPWAASARAVSTPRPAETPVTRMRLPLRSTPSQHFVGGGGGAERSGHGLPPRLFCLGLVSAKPHGAPAPAPQIMNPKPTSTYIRAGGCIRNF